MRIRKHAKISPLVYAVSTLKPGIILQPHVCQLNQSPWDVASFSPPPPSQVNGSGESDCGLALEREDVMEEVEEDDPPPVSPPAIVMCCKTDGKSWQCRREASEGHPMCEHHLALVKSYSSNSGKSAAAGEAAAQPPRHPRPKKAPARYSFDRGDDFIYYSEFVPFRGKNRGECSKGDPTARDEDDVKEIERDRIGAEEYEEDDDEEDVGKKRVRKKIKARSLKSLM